MAVIDESKVRTLAHQLWEKDGQQSGKDHDYWHAAEQLLADEGEADTSADAPTVVPILPLPAGLK